MQRSYYSSSINEFLEHGADTILGVLTRNSEFAVEDTQRGAWLYQIDHLKRVLPRLRDFGDTGLVQFEYAIPRMGRRIDVLLLLSGILFVLEYKVGESGAPGVLLIKLLTMDSI